MDASEDNVGKGNSKLSTKAIYKTYIVLILILSGMDAVTPDLLKVTTLTTDLQMIYPLFKLSLCSVKDKLYETLLPMSIKDDITSR